MRKRIVDIILCSALIFCFFLSAGIAAEGDHPLGKISGKGIDLLSLDHKFMGFIKQHPVMGMVDEESFTSDLTIIVDGAMVTGRFKKQDDGTIGGAIIQKKDDTLVKTAMLFKKLDKEKQTIVIEVNGNEVIVAITAEAFEDGHFINPTYTASVEGKSVAYTMQGKACFGYSLHNVFLILGGYLHLPESVEDGE